ncbi:MAG: DUF1987 domain-containing protein [Microscillaceae bacterium]|nr:DUF1987 domain-containing protein [Microscillaceae bacterium]
MENLILEARQDDFSTPAIRFNLEKGIFEMEGESFLENTFEFYAPVFEWLKEWKQKWQGTAVFNFKFTYFNSSSSKALLQIMAYIRDYAERGEPVAINWFYPDDNPDLLQEGEDFMETLNIPITFIPFEVEY